MTEQTKDFPPEDYQDFDSIPNLQENLDETGAFIKGQDGGDNTPRIILSVILQGDTGDPVINMESANTYDFSKKITAEMISNAFKIYDEGINHLQNCKQQLADYVKETNPVEPVKET